MPSLLISWVILGVINSPLIDGFGINTYFLYCHKKALFTINSPRFYHSYHIKMIANDSSAIIFDS